MRQVADGVHLITGFPPYAINCYLVEHPDGDVLLDAMTRLEGRLILKALRGRRMAAHVVGHAHPDHVGATHAVASELGIPVWAHAADAAAVEDTGLIDGRQPDKLINHVFAKVMLGPGHPVARTLDEGDEVAGFTSCTCPATALATSRCGASATACSSSATCSTTSTRSSASRAACASPSTRSPPTRPATARARGASPTCR